MFWTDPEVIVPQKHTILKIDREADMKYDNDNLEFALKHEAELKRQDSLRSIEEEKALQTARGRCDSDGVSF